MIPGTVNANREAVVVLRVRGPGGQEQDSRAVIDTGFTGFLTLPPAIVTALDLVRVSRGRAILANGAEELFDIYRGTVLWDGQPRIVETEAADTDPLVGMSMLYGYKLQVEAIDGGTVTIEALP